MLLWLVSELGNIWC